VHLVNYRADLAATNVAVRVRVPAGKQAKAVTLANPERSTDLEIPFTQEAEVVAFTVPEVTVYEIAVVRTE